MRDPLTGVISGEAANHFEAKLQSAPRSPYGQFVPRARADQVLDLWADLWTANDIAEAVGVSVDGVKCYIEAARKRGDPRADRVFRDRQQYRGEARKRVIGDLQDQGWPLARIAGYLDVSVRLVQMRAREAR